MHTRTWEDPVINQTQTQNQAKQNDGPKETQKKMPHMSHLNYHEGMTPSLSLPLCLSTRTLFPPKEDFTCFTTFSFFVEINFLQSCMGQGLVADHW